ncbi:unnamed protein product [Didymodactylos carnosus]|uniref:Transcription initiation factor IIA subunit 2 n=1 Tax=Didymodactylos carnosus TaxID=1234261 RepID=A0A815FEP2_9BILA|nr:unnamed protein product [Didymodactylos carnosus]CAF1327572.1 unnamed protein product [Didymodactylos carnosus]CAF4061922.1 unnamed protein product [Didymodactylos carnosus]CAF4178396.1 unnamed protein product [Didymodactylos carnosus]
MSTYQIYRNTTLGVTLQDTLDEMISQGSLTEQAAGKVLSEFDRAINVALEKRTNKKCNFQGKLSTYRFCDNVWTLVLKEFTVKDPSNSSNSPPLHVDKVKIVACDGKATPT